MYLHSWWYISSSETIRLLYYKQDCKMCITAIKSNLYQMMSFLPQVHWYVFLKLNHRGKNLVTMKTVKLLRTWRWWLRLGHNYTHLTSHGTCGSYFCILLVLRITIEMAKWIWRLPHRATITHMWPWDLWSWTYFDCWANIGDIWQMRDYTNGTYVRATITQVTMEPVVSNSC